jgi:hypothetical protein
LSNDRGHTRKGRNTVRKLFRLSLRFHMKISFSVIVIRIGSFNSLASHCAAAAACRISPRVGGFKA